MSEIISEDKVRVSTLKQALVTLRGAKLVYMHARLNAYLHSDPDLYRPDGFGAGIEVTKRAAMKFVRDVFTYAPKGDKADGYFFAMSVTIRKGMPVRNRRTGEYGPAPIEKIVWIGGVP